MDIKHPRCDSASHPKDKLPKMVRLYKRIDGKFIPVAWQCPDCGIIKKEGP